MDLQKETIFLYDSTFISNATLEVSPSYIEKNSNILKSSARNDWLHLVDKINKKLETKGLITEEVLVESGMISAKKERLINREVLKTEPRFKERLKFFDGLLKNKFDHIDFNISSDEAFSERKDKFFSIKSFYKEKNIWSAGSQIATFGKHFKGEQFGDKSILKHIENNPDKNFFVVTSDHRLGLNVNKQPNSSSMNLAGLYTSLRDFGTLRGMGFKEILPNGNVFDDCIRIHNKGSWQKGVITSDSFEGFLQQKGFERIKDKATTIRIDYKDRSEELSRRAI